MPKFRRLGLKPVVLPREVGQQWPETCTTVQFSKQPSRTISLLDVISNKHSRDSSTEVLENGIASAKLADTTSPLPVGSVVRIDFASGDPNANATQQTQITATKIFLAGRSE
jgi:hypothetical protein